METSERITTLGGPRVGDQSEQRFVVGLGASAGGLQALEAFFHALPPDTGASYVVVQHLSPDFQSRMDELLGRHTQMTVLHVEEETELRPDTVYLAPASKEMIVQGNRLILSDRDREGLPLPIDHFFRSLAQDAGSKAIAIVLSGTGSDGSRGVTEVHGVGGLVLCQSPESCRFDGMPKSAIKTGKVHACLPPQDLAEAIVTRLQTRASSGETTEMPPIEGPEARVFAAVRDDFGIDFAQYKASTVSRRLERRMNATGVDSMSAYADFIETSPEEASALYQDLLIGVTEFFRDAEAFEALEKHVIPELVERATPGETIRVWVAGCATGEEAYSVAILLREAVECSDKRLSGKVFATDVHRGSLDVASSGRYPAEAIADLPQERIQRNFSVEDEHAQVDPGVRSMVVFAPHNLLSDAPFTRMDLIVCRNLLIYLQSSAQRKVLSLFHFALRSRGTLFLGPSESVGHLDDEFEEIDARWRLYRKRRDVRLSPGIPFGYEPPRPVSRSRDSSGTGDSLLQASYDQLLDRFMPPAFLVDEAYRLLHSFGGSERFLRVRGGRPTASVVDLVQDDLEASLAGALRHASKQRSPVRYSGLTIEDNGEQVAVQLVVTPIHHRRVDRTHFLISLELAPIERKQAIEEVTASQADAEYVSSLESELRVARENLQATVEELETSNEELQASNEELVASNEELQSTNEELHSVNEELYSVNSEYQRKIEELTELNHDMDNLLHSTEVGVVFLDEGLKLRRFTKMAGELFRLRAEDLGRELEDFVNNLGDDRLLEDARMVLAGGEAVEREIRARTGPPVLVRALPYQAEGRTTGVVVTLVDIAAVKERQADIERLGQIVQHSSDAIISLDPDGTILSWNRGARRLYGYAAEEILGTNIERITPNNRRAELRRTLDFDAEADETRVLETAASRKDGLPLLIARTVSPVRDGQKKFVGVSFIDRDISEQKRAEADIRRTVRQRERFMALLSHELRNPLAAMLGACAVLEKRHDGDVEGRAVDVLHRQTRHVARLLDDLLDVSRMRQDGIEMRMEALDLRDVIDPALETAAAALKERSIEVEVHRSDEPLRVKADPTRLEQLVVNLLTNAARYSPVGGAVRLSVARDEPEAVITVEDEGKGIPSDMLDRIFDPFVRAESNRDFEHEAGMGLGLALVRSIAEAHEGLVTAHSDGLGRGSRFEVRLPLSTADEDAPQPPKPTPVPFLPGEQVVLLVEDSEDSRLLLCELLQMRGWKVLAAGDGPTALQMLDGSPPRAAVVDIGLPGMSGLDVAKALRQRFGDELPLIAMTGWGRQEDRDRVLRAGFDRHLVKPVEPDLLIDLLAET